MTDSPTFDGDGYPTEETLMAIRKWPEDWNSLLEYVREAWTYKDRITNVDSTEEYHPGDFWYLSTGGWSGNEDIIGALQANAMFWICCWWSSRRGGHFEFIVPKRSPAKQKKDVGQNPKPHGNKRRPH